MKKMLIGIMTALLPFLAQAQQDDQLFGIPDDVNAVSFFYWQTDVCNNAELGVYDPFDLTQRVDLTTPSNPGSALNKSSAFGTLSWVDDLVTNDATGENATIPRQQFGIYATCNGTFWSTVVVQSAQSGEQWWNDTLEPSTVWPYEEVVTVTYPEEDDNQAQIYFNGPERLLRRSECPVQVADDPQCGDTLPNGDAYEEPDPDKPYLNACYDPTQFCSSEPRNNCRFVEPYCCGA